MKVVIADDEALARDLIRRLLGELGEVEVLAEAANGADALAAVRDLRPDVIFLDVDMPGLDGMQAAAGMLPLTTDIVFVTAHETHAVEAFELGACDYLLKPVRRPRLAMALQRARARIAARQAQSEGAAAPTRTASAGDVALWVPTRRGAVRVEAKDIVRVEAAKDHVYLHTAERAYFMRMTMADAQKRLGGEGLLRVHRSALVRPEAVTTLLRRGKALSLALVDGAVIPVGATYRSETLARVTGAEEG